MKRRHFFIAPLATSGPALAVPAVSRDGTCGIGAVANESFPHQAAQVR